jgi:hypothetical protein
MDRLKATRFLRILSWLAILVAKANHSKQRLRVVFMGQQNPPAGGSRKISFNVSDQYEIQDVIGEGAYGVVW